MRADPKKFRDWAIDCRALAKGARSQIDASFLEDMAEELDAAARKIEAEEGGEQFRRPERRGPDSPLRGLII